MTIGPQSTTIVAGVIRRGDQVLLVRRQGADNSAVAWALPGGTAETGELLSETLTRELREETGLEIQTPGQLAYVAQLHNPSEHSWSPGETPAAGGLTTAFVFEVDQIVGQIATTALDDSVTVARYFSLADALDELGRLPGRYMREPIVAYLRGDVATGQVWLYRRQPDGREELVIRLPDKTGSAISLEAQSDGRPRDAELGLRPQYTFVVLGCLILLLVFAVLIVIGIVSVHK